MLLIKSLGFNFVDVSLFLWVNKIKKKKRLSCIVLTKYFPRVIVLFRKETWSAWKRNVECDPKKFETNKLKNGKEPENNCGDDEQYCWYYRWCQLRDLLWWSWSRWGWKLLKMRLVIDWSWRLKTTSMKSYPHSCSSSSSNVRKLKKEIYYSNVKHFDTTYFPYMYFEDICSDKVYSNSCISRLNILRVKSFI